VRAAKGYSLAIYALPDDRTRALEPDSEPLLRIELPAGATSWTPGLDECLPGAGRYGWTVGARSAEPEPRWSPPGVFRVIAEREPPVGRTPDPETAVSPSTYWQVAPTEPRPEPMKPSNVRSVTSEAFAPPACSGTFTDVVGNPYCGWIEQLYLDKITIGCGPSKYCPDHPVTRAQMAAYLGRAMHGTDTWQPGQTGGATGTQPPSDFTITALDTAGDVGQHTSITIGADGLGLISYYDVTNQNLKVAHCSNLECSAATITTLDSAGDVGENTSITIGTDGLGLISYLKDDPSDGDLKVAHCSNVACTAATITTLDNPASDFNHVGRGTAITISGNGLGIVAYYDLTLGNLKVAACADVACTSATSILVADSTGDVGKYPAIAQGLSGFPEIAYLDETNHTLKVARCNFVDCSPPTLNTVSIPGVTVNGHISVAIRDNGSPIISFQGDDSFWTVSCSDLLCLVVEDTTQHFGSSPNGLYTSIAIGVDRLPLISYYSGDMTSPLVVHCSTPECGSTTLDQSDKVFGQDRGSYGAITIGADGLGLWSYYDAVNHDLRVAHCPNVLCNAYFRRR
jgi:hypothetical protein